MRKRTTKSNHKKTHRKHRGGTRRKMPAMGNPGKSHIVKVFLECLNMIKLYHWKTHSYSQHKATDELSSKLHENVDSFIEVLLGKRGDRINLRHVKRISLKDFDSVSEFKREMEKFKGYLVNLDNESALKTMSNSDIYNIRDEMLANINQFLYLLTFK